MPSGIAQPQGEKRPARTTGTGSSHPAPGGGFPGGGNRGSKKAQQLLMNESQLQLLDHNIQALNFFVNHGYMAVLNSGVVQKPEALPNNRSDEISVYELTRLMLNEGENTYEKLISVYASLNASASSVGIIIKSDGSLWTWGRNNLGQLGNGT